MSLTPVAIKKVQPWFLNKFLSFFYVCKLTDDSIYWNKYKADFTLYPLSERETLPDLIRSSERQIQNALIRNSTYESPNLRTTLAIDPAEESVACKYLQAKIKKRQETH